MMFIVLISKTYGKIGRFKQFLKNYTLNSNFNFTSKLQSAFQTKINVIVKIINLNLIKT